MQEKHQHINSILIANRGEIACRIIRTCQKMGIKSIAVFSEADRHAPFVTMADVSLYIGDSNPSASYLAFDKIIEAAQKSGADAIHPGYGFLSENVAFAERCTQEGIVFIGPHVAAIEAMGSKSQAKSLMKKHGVPVVPGYQGDDQTVETLKKAALSIGFPVLLKATAGGGGKGMRIVHQERELEAAIFTAKREAKSAFGDDELIIEKYIASGRHIEFQIFGDKHGNALHLLERECTIQRRYQKVIEESPSRVMSESLRQTMGDAAVNAAKALNYDNAGTVEFIYDDKTGDFYFLEVNTRLQVEHPVTEEITGLDLVQMQIEVAQGLPLAITQADVKSKGYAVEVRLYAEDPANQFLPVTGVIEKFEVPNVQGLRVEAGIRDGSEISIFYDPMIAKIIVWSDDRSQAHRKMAYVLRKMVCSGITTNQDFLLHLITHPDFQKGNYDTHFIQNKINTSDFALKKPQQIHIAALAATLHNWHRRAQNRPLLRALPSGWRNNFYQAQQDTFIFNEEEISVKYRYLKGGFSIQIGEQNYQVHIVEVQDNHIRIEIDGMQYPLSIVAKKDQYFIQNDYTGAISMVLKDRLPIKEAEKIAGAYIAPMPSQIIKILVKEGQKVTAGQPLIILSSMKMENTLLVETDGIVEEVYTTEGANVEAGFILLKLKSDN